MKEESYPPLNCKERQRPLILLVLHCSSGFISSPKKHPGCAALLNLSVNQHCNQCVVLNTRQFWTSLRSKPISTRQRKSMQIHKTALARNLENLNINMIFSLNQRFIFENRYCYCLYPVCRRKGRKNNLLWHFSLFTHKKVGGPFSQSPHTAAACPSLTALTALSITPPRTLGDALSECWPKQSRAILS